MKKKGVNADVAGNEMKKEGEVKGNDKKPK